MIEAFLRGLKKKIIPIIPSSITKDWSELKMALACPLFLSIIVFFFMPESPRWLLLNGRLDEAKQVLEKAIKVNGGTWPEGFELKKIEQTIGKDSE